ncbi:MAG: hypothetical protein IKM46_00870 [Clostridia bacterium]|nr:hypothetical protein [Clostridia bacterium]
MDIIIFSGQSNMQGQCECLSDSTPVDGAVEFKFLTGCAVPLKNPVGENIKCDFSEGYTFTNGTDQDAWLRDHALGAACYGHTNLVPKFCEEYVHVTGREVLAVHAAKGSTTVKDWLPESASLDALVKKALAAKKYAEAERIFFVWLQGESDAIEGKSREVYKARLEMLNSILKTELGIEKFGIIRVGRFTMNAKDDEIITAQDEICVENPDFVMLTRIATELNEIPEYMHPQIHGHYSAKGLEKLGIDAGHALGEMVK